MQSSLARSYETATPAERARWDRSNDIKLSGWPNWPVRCSALLDVISREPIVMDVEVTSNLTSWNDFVAIRVYQRALHFKL